MQGCRDWRETSLQTEIKREYGEAPPCEAKLGLREEVSISQFGRCLTQPRNEA